MVWALVLGGLIVHAVVLTGSFRTMDDEISIVNNQNLRSFSSVGRMFTESFFHDDRAYYRPLVNLSFLFDYQIAGLRPWFYYLTNLLLHVGNGVLLFFIFNVLFKKQFSSFIAALLFLIHPIQWEAVANIAGRSILLCAFWQFVCFLLYVTVTGQSRLNPHRKVYYTAALAAFGLALLSKESAVVTPFLLAGYEYWMHRPLKGKIFGTEAAVRLVPFGLLTLGYLALRKFLGITSVGFWPSGEFLALGVLTFLSSVLVAFRVFLLPVDLHFDRATAYFTGFADPGAGLTLAGVVIFIWFLGRYHAQWGGGPKFLLFWFGITLLPVAQLIPLPAHIGYAATADHFYYVPSAGLFALFVMLGDGLAQRLMHRKIISRKSLSLVLAAIVGYFMLMTLGQNLHAVHDLSMFERSLAYNPANTRVRISYGLALAKLRLFAQAEGQFRRVLAAEPWDGRARIGLAKSLCDQGKCLEAIFEYEAVREAGNLQELLDQNLKYTYDVVIRQYQQRLLEEPHNSQLHYSLGVVYAKAGREREAAREYYRALRLDPRARLALYNLGVLLESGTVPVSAKQKQAAARYFKRVIALGQEDDQLSEYAYRHLAEIYERRGQERRARAYLKAAERIAGKDG